MATSSIEWTEATWNPVTGCTRVSRGCDLCYAAALTKRLDAMGQAKYAGLVNPGKDHFNGVIRIHADTLNIPRMRRKPTTYFVNSMSDLFHRDVPVDVIAEVFAVMADTPRHRYQVLTKRPERMAEVMPRVYKIIAERTGVSHAEPLANVWMGTSVEEQAVSDRVDYLRNVPAAIRFLSCEPLLGELSCLNLDGIHWVIAGGESGHGARPMKSEWVEDLLGQCRRAGVAFFFKQAGSVLARQWGDRSKGGDMKFWPEHLRVREYPG